MPDKSFQLFDLETGCLSEMCDQDFPTSVFAWNDEKLALITSGATHFGYVFRGDATLKTQNGEFKLREKMYFCAPEMLEIEGGAGIVITRREFVGMFGIGGKIEGEGRLRYIDGCCDTLLIAPPVKGDPCLNALYFPPGIRQTAHTHPSVRAGIVAEGAGECVTEDGVFQLKAGAAFIIAPNALHSFNTFNEKMTVIAYHPDTDFGATHEDHPMVNRTIVEGISAAQIAAIRTKE